MMGLREMVLIALVTFVLYGRTGMTKLRSERAQTILPWLSPVRRHPRPGAKAQARAREAEEEKERPRSRLAGRFLFRGNRLFWFWTVLAATAVAVWIITRTLITSGVSP